MFFGQLSRELLFAVCLTGLLAACSSTLPIERKVPQQPASSVGEAPISRKVLLLGDTQLNEFYGAPVFLAGEVAQDISGVAVRPAQKRLFGSELLKRVIEWNKQSDNLPIIHMGDAIDVSCRTEWERFVKLMERNRAEWALVPGNHDGYFEGIIYPEEDEDPSEDRPPRDHRYGNKNWDLRCTESRKNNLRKPDFISAYLETKKLCSIENPTDTPVLCKGRQENLVETVIYRIAKKPWQSFLLQVIRLPPFNADCGTTEGCIPVFGLLLDTSQYEKSRRLFKFRDLLGFEDLSDLCKLFTYRTAGTNGEILQDQTDEAVAVIERLRKERPNARIILFGHHDLHSLRQATRKRLAKMITAGAQPLYVSAHTHLGSWNSRRLHDGINVMELNVGSLLDWPIHFRDFQLFAGSARNVVHSNAYLFSRNFNNGGNGLGDLTCDSAWFPNVNTTRGQERVDLRDRLIPNRVKAFFKSLEFRSKDEASKERWQFLVRNLRAELWEYQALLDTFPSSELTKYRGEIETELKNPGVDSRLRLLSKLRADETKDETKVDSDQLKISAYKACLAVEAAEKVPIHDKKIMRAKQKHIDCIKESCAVIGGKVPPSCDGL